MRKFVEQMRKNTSEEYAHGFGTTLYGATEVSVDGVMESRDSVKIMGDATLAEDAGVERRVLR